MTPPRPMRPAFTACATFALFAVFALFPRRALAQPSQSDLANRIQLLQAAQQAATSGQHQQALELAQRANSIQRSTPSLRLVTEEQAALNMFVEAMATAAQCAHQALVDPPSPARDANAQRCAQVATAMQSRAGQVFVEVPTPAPSGLSVTLNGNELSSAFWGVVYLVNPGALEVVVRAPGFKTFTHSAQVAAGSYPTMVHVELEREAVILPTHTDQPPIPSPVAYVTRSSISPVGPALIGVGVAGMALAAVLHFAVAAPAGQFYRDNCQDPWVCTRALTDDTQGGAAAVDAGAAVALVVGAATAVTGGVLTGVFKNTTRVRVDVVAFDPLTRTVVLSGRF